MILLGNDGIIFVKMKWKLNFISATLFHFLKNSQRYHSLLAACLMLVMLVSIMPKRYLHDIIAHHIDEKGCLIHQRHDIKGSSLSLAGFNCQVDELVIASGFVQPYYQIQLSPLIFHQSLIVVGEAQPIVSFRSLNDLRGPPSICI